MNEFILQKLKSTKIADTSNINIGTCEIILPKVESSLPKPITITIGHSYIIEVANYIINPPPNFDLHINWNNNNIPKFSCMKCKVTHLIGKMVKLNAISYDKYNNIELSDTWEGWIPQKSILNIKEI